MKDWLDGWKDQETRKRWIESFGEVFDWMSGPRYWPDVLDNVWLGVSVDNQAAADERIPLLLQTPAAVRFISAEPLLGPIDIGKWIGPRMCYCGWRGYEWEEIPDPENDNETICPNCEASSQCELGDVDTCCGYPDGYERHPLHWVIVGGESGPGARPMHPDWVRSLRDQCQAADVPFFFKQWGEWFVPEDGAESCRVCGCTWHNACEGSCFWVEPGLCSNCVGKQVPDYRAVKFQRVGKKEAGRILHGQIWDEMPEVQR